MHPTLQPLLNSIGILLALGGGSVLFWYGFPQPDFSTGCGILAEDNTPMGDGRTAKEHGEDAKRLEAKYKFRSVSAMALIVLGGVVQLIAAWL